MREVEERARTLRTELADLDAQIVATERALTDARAQRDRELAADQIEALAAAIERAGPGFGAGAAGLVEAVTRGPATVTEATKFAASVDAIRREVMSATDLICWELRTIAVRTRAGNANATPSAPAEAEHTVPVEIERQRIYTLNPLLWREGSEVCKAPAFTMVGLPKALLRGRIAASACRLSQRPPRPDADACAWQRTGRSARRCRAGRPRRARSRGTEQGQRGLMGTTPRHRRLY